MSLGIGIDVRIKRIYEAPGEDGERVLVDRLWPRGVAKDAARIDQWLKDLAPSDALRVWFGHDPSRWGEFRRRYRRELAAHRGQIQALRRLARQRPLTLLYSARDPRHNQAVVLRAVILGRASPGRNATDSQPSR